MGDCLPSLFEDCGWTINTEQVVPRFMALDPTDRKPTVKHVRVFGCKAYAHASAATRRKLNPKSKPCILIGYGLTSEAYRLFDVEKHTLFTPRYIIFSETEKSLLKKTGDTSRNAIFFPDSSETDDIFAENDSFDATGDFCPDDSADSSIVIRYEGAPEDFLGFPDSAKSEAGDASSAVESDSDYIPPETVDVENENLRRGTRDKRPPIHLQDYDLNFVSTVLSDDPVTVDDVLSRPEKEEWRKAINREYKAHLGNGTWELVDLPPGRKPLKCKRVLCGM
ncbi:hypothetical protein JTB14_012120 [Gonioctena quinquepunctata]|nr:hypothetical protein JTB14_012120 [Gonioctena quinquepunctata]